MKLDPALDLKRIEEATREQLGRARRACDPDLGQIAMIEGPPTMNGAPHVGHVRGRVIKDLWYRYKTLCGYDVRYSAGWDAQGLPVELQAQKELGIEGSKSEIGEERIGELVAECKRIVASYNEKWVEADRLLGMSADCASAYWTYRDEFIEREWGILRRAGEQGVLRDDYTVIAYCPSCQTSLSHTEAAQGYREVKDPSLYYKVRLEDDPAYLIVWTTMPFTLVTDALVGVHPDETYCTIEARGQRWIVGKTRLAEFAKTAGLEGYDIVSEARGAELDGKKYVHPLLAEIPALAGLAADQNYHRVVAEKFVDTATGTGLVHISPANGEEDIRVARRRRVKVFNPIDDEVKFTADAGKYAGTFVRDADAQVIADLENCGALVRAAKIRHKYPHCWRSGDALVWLARRGWFYMLDDIGGRILEAASGVEYYYEPPRNRFLGIVSEGHPWCISRERFWGTPLPVWSCGDCGKKTWLYSRQEILGAAEALPDGEDFELHMPWIDRITVRCSSCGSTKTSRERYVLDTWHNSGSAPHSSLDDSSYSRLVPVPFLTEGIDQTRGWAYTLLVENVILSGAPAPPYSSFLFQGHVLDHNGNKMSKSEGNVIDACELLARRPADLVRFYFAWKSSPIEALSFDEREMMARPYQVLSTLYNMHSYFEQNSSYDEFDPARGIGDLVGSDRLAAPDSWILSVLQDLVEGVTQDIDACRLHEAARRLEAFVIGELSQTYVPITRSGMWDEGEAGERRRDTVYAVIAHVLRTVDILLHPICPYTTEYLLRAVFGEAASASAARWPRPDGRLVNRDTESAFELMRGLVSAGSAARSAAGLKRRWPLESATLVVGRGQGESIRAISGIVCSQLNVESVSIVEADASLRGPERAAELRSLGLPVRPRAALEAKSCGPKARDLMPQLVAEFPGMDHEKISAELAKSGSFTVRLGDRDLVLGREDVSVSAAASGDNAIADRDGLAVIVTTVRSEEMVCRGLIRDLARRLQALRKERGYNPTDVLDYASITGLDGAQASMLGERLEEIAFLVRVRKASLEEIAGAEYAEGDVDGQPIRIAVG